MRIFYKLPTITESERHQQRGLVIIVGCWIMVDCLRHSTDRLVAIMNGIVFLPAQHSADLLNLKGL